MTTAQTPAPAPPVTEDSVRDTVIAWRRRLHQDPELSFHEERTAQFVERYREHFRAREARMGLFPGMRELIEQLSASRALGIATGKSRRGLDRALEAAGLRPYFRASRCADETQPKPHPAMLRELMEELGVAAGQALMVGDTSHDMEMARAAGVDALAVTYGAHPEMGLRACRPRGCVASVQELGEWLATNG